MTVSVNRILGFVRRDRGFHTPSPAVLGLMANLVLDDRVPVVEEYCASKDYWPDWALARRAAVLAGR